MTAGENAGREVQKGFPMFNVYGRKLPDPQEIAHNLIQLANEDQGRMRRLALRSHGSRACLFGFGSAAGRWWISPVCFSGLMIAGFLMRDWSWHTLDLLLTRIGFY